MAVRASQRPITALTRVNCAQMFFIYPGRADVTYDQGLTFLSLIRSAGLGDRNLALIADPYGDNYMRGVSPHTPDLDSLLEWHRRFLAQFPHVSEVYHLGHSSGGYGALLFGHLLGAKRVWAFAPRTAQLATADTAKAFLKGLLSQGTGATEHVVYYSLANRRDCDFAAYLAECPGIVLTPYDVPPPAPAGQPGAAYGDAESWYHWGVMRTLIARGDLRAAMPPFVRAV